MPPFSETKELAYAAISKFQGAQEAGYAEMDVRDEPDVPEMDLIVRGFEPLHAVLAAISEDLDAFFGRALGPITEAKSSGIPTSPVPSGTLPQIRANLSGVLDRAHAIRSYTSKLSRIA